jgi:hypothetical protein
MMTDKATQLYRLHQKEDGSYEATPIETAPIARRSA